MWRYFFYYVYLQRKVVTDYTHKEHFVNQCLNNPSDATKVRLAPAVSFSSSCACALRARPPLTCHPTSHPVNG